MRDQYTTLPDITNRPLHMWLDLEWLYTESSAGFSSGAVTAAVRRMVREVFDGFESGSIQQVIYQIGTQMLAEIPASPKFIWRRTTGLGIPLRSAARSWASTPKRGRRSAFLAYA